MGVEILKVWDYVICLPFLRHNICDVYNRGGGKLKIRMAGGEGWAARLVKVS